MIVDASTVDRSVFTQEVDVCVIGSGPAGITIARRLAVRGARVALMEAGGLELTAESQEIYEGAVTGQDYFPLDVTRLRYFGGTSNHWAGWCRALDPVDFAPKAFNPYSGWPIDKLDVDPYRIEADAILDIPSASEVPDLPMAQGGYDFKRFQFRWSPPTVFAEKYRADIEASENIRLVLNANLLDLRLAPGLGAVDAAVFRSFGPVDAGFEVRARHFCLCTGGIENARLLLNFRGQVPEGIGNGNDLVGRFFCEHPHFVLADVLLPGEPLDEMSFYAPSEQFVMENQVLNFGLRFEPGPWPPTRIASLARRPSELPFMLRLVQQLRAGDNVELRRAVDAVHMPLVATARLRIAQEQALNPQSRVHLAPDKDRFGLARAALDWRLSELDVRTMRGAGEAFGGYLASAGIGRARMREWLMKEPAEIPGISEDEVGGKHHMCTTRMADNPRHGVVDAQCGVHGLTNLHIGGSSVFATPGHANPTYTIVQLALRLGDHLIARLQG